MVLASDAVTDPGRQDWLMVQTDLETTKPTKPPSSAAAVSAAAAADTMGSQPTKRRPKTMLKQVLSTRKITHL